MIHEYATDLASQMGINLTKVSLAKGSPTGSLDAYLLQLTSDGKMVSERIHQSELDSLQNGHHNELLEIKIRSALVRLKMLLEP